MKMRIYFYLWGWGETKSLYGVACLYWNSLYRSGWSIHLYIYDASVSLGAKACVTTFVLHIYYLLCV